MQDVIERLAILFEPSWAGLVNVLDILLVAYVVYRILKLVRGTRAFTGILGIGVFLAILFLSEKLGLKTLHWILDKATLLAPVALVILFLPELRQAIEGFAKVGLWSRKLITSDLAVRQGVLDEITTACAELSETSTGALIVVERNNRLDDIAGTGVPVRGVVTAQLLRAVFYEGNPLHDGAVIVRGDEVAAAACRLPMSENEMLGNQYHMRHRAGLGMSEHSDSVVIIVSEERGHIAVAVNGRLDVVTSIGQLRARLDEELGDPKGEDNEPRTKRAKKVRSEAVAK